MDIVNGRFTAANKSPSGFFNVCCQLVKYIVSDMDTVQFLYFRFLVLLFKILGRSNDENGNRFHCQACLKWTHEKSNS